MIAAMNHRKALLENRQVGLFGRQEPTFLLKIVAASIAVALAAAVCGGSATAAATAELRPDPALVQGRLDNGVAYAILPNREPRERISLRLLVKAGSLHEGEEERGLAHYLEHMGFRGTENFAAGTLVEYFQNLGMAFGADTNAYTGFDRTVYMIELPSPEPEKVAEALTVLRDYASRMLIEEAEVEAERGVILAEKRDRDSVAYRATRALFDFLLPESIIPQRFPIGAREVIASATAAQLRDFYEKWYRPEGIALILVGELEPPEILPLLEEHFGDFQAARPAVPEPELGRVVADGLQIRLHHEPEAARLRLSIQTMQPYAPPEDSPARRSAELNRRLAMLILQRRFDRLARREDAVFEQARVFAHDYFDFFTNGSIELTTKAEEWRPALQLAERELRRALDHGFPEEELTEARATILREYREAARQANTRNNRNLAESLVRHLVADRIFTHPQDDFKWAEAVLAELTKDAVDEAFSEVWREPGRFIFVSGNLDLAEPEATIAKVYRESFETPVQAWSPPPPEEFAYVDFGPPGEIESRNDNRELELSQIVFANGVRLNFKRTDFAEGEILLLARLGHGRLTEPADRPGWTGLAGMVFIEGGLQQHSHEDLRRLFAGTTVGWNLQTEADAFVFGGTTNQEDLPRQLQLLAAYLTAPGFREEALRLARRRLPEIYNQTRRTSQGVLQRQVANFLAGGDHRFGLPEMETMLEYEMAQLREWLADTLAEGYLEISVVGDFKPEALLEACRQTLAALPPRRKEKEAKEELRKLNRPASGQEKTFHFQSRLPGGRALVYWPIPDIYEIERTRRLSVLASVFRDRMRRQIREDLGDTYSAFAVSRPDDTFRDYGWFVASAGAEADNAAEITRVTRLIGRELHDDGITEDELQRALLPILNSVRDSRRSNQYWLHSVLGGSQERPERLRWAREIVDDFAAITASDLDRLARRHLDPEKAITIFVLPQDE